MLLSNNQTKCLVESYMNVEFGPKVMIATKLQSMVWIFRSSLNKKNPLFGPEKESEDKPKLAGLWRQMKDELDDFSLKFIQKRIY